MSGLFLTVAATIAMAGIANGRLLETQSETEARYGRPVKVEDSSYGKAFTYTFKKYRLVVTFVNGRSQNEVYQRVDGKTLVAAEIGMLMHLNQLNKTWE